MADMIDSANPANLPVGLDGQPALRISVAADPKGQAFDVEKGNSSPGMAAAACRVRYEAGFWSVGYTNESDFPAFTDELRAVKLGWADAAGWPKPGVYLWAADPGPDPPHGLPHSTVTWAPVIPIAVQYRWAPALDFSRVPDRFPARVAGYVDGRYAWPQTAWDRFRPIPNQPPVPAPHPKGTDMFLVVAKTASTDGTVPAQTQWVISTTRLQVTSPNNDEWSALLGQVPTPVSGDFIAAIPPAA